MTDSAGTGSTAPTLEVSTAITPTDHGQIVVVFAWLSFTAGVMISAVRMQVRWPSNSRAGKDDIACAVSTMLAFVQTAIVLNTVRNGLGRMGTDLGAGQAMRIAKNLYATDLLFLVSIWTGKLSIALLFKRLAKESNKSRLGWVLKALVFVFSIVSILSVAFRPHVSRPWIYREGDVVSALARWIVSGSLSIAFDLIALGLSIYLVKDLQTTSKSKSLVITAFTLRLLVAPITIVRLVALSRVQHEDISFTYVPPEAMAQLELYCSVVSTTLPCLRLFLAAWNTSFMDLRLEEFDNDVYRQHTTAQSHSGSRGSALRSGDVGKHHASRTSRNAWAPSSGTSRATVEGGNWARDEDAASDHSERAIIVKRTVDVTDDAQSKG